jgi:hypothetical protein
MHAYKDAIEDLVVRMFYIRTVKKEVQVVSRNHTV